MEILKNNKIAALGALAMILLIAALVGVPFAAFAVVFLFAAVALYLTRNKDDVRARAKKVADTLGAAVKRHRTLVILVGVYFLADVLKQSGLEMIAFLAIIIKCLTPWKRFKRSLGLEVSTKTTSTEKADAN